MLLAGLLGVAAAGAAAAPAAVSSFTASARARFCFLQLATTDAAARACTMPRLDFQKRRLRGETFGCSRAFC